MKRGIILLVLIILLSSFISADIIFNEQIKPVYNLGDNIFVPVTIKSVKDISGIFQMNLICGNETQTNFYKNGVKLISGEEKSMDSSLVLIKSIIGDSTGMCKIKAILNGEYVLSSEFKISSLLSIGGNLEKSEFDAGESISITGKVTKENGEIAKGFIEAKIVNNIYEDIIQSGTVTDGVFSMNISLPTDLRAGSYSLEIKASEKDNDGVVTNNGLTNYNISVRQVPTNLELVFEKKEVIPGDSLKVKIILHDQTGDQINSTVFITIKNSFDKILEQKEVNTDETIEYLIKFNEPPAEWKVFAASNKLTAEDQFKIKEKESISVEIINKTISITNVGNVLYNKTLLIKVGEIPLNIHVTLNVGENKKYILSAPDGEYNVRIITGDENETGGIMSLTGEAVGIKEASGVSFGIAVWILLILILMIIAYIIFRKIYKKPFFGRHIPFQKGDSKKMFSMKKDDYKIIAKIGNKAELSLSIKGEQQDASVVCLKVKNLKEIKSGKGSAAESIKKIINLAEEDKAAVYENQDYLFFILASTNTKTFKNERMALDIAEKIKDILTEHNKMFNQKMDFGISLNYGTIVAKVENGVFKFMSMGSLITSAKKIASISHGEVLLSEKINDLLRLQQVKTEKNVRNGISVFSVTGIKKEDEEARKFIDRFMNRQNKG